MYTRARSRKPTKWNVLGKNPKVQKSVQKYLQVHEIEESFILFFFIVKKRVQSSRIEFTLNLWFPGGLCRCKMDPKVWSGHKKAWLSQCSLAYHGWGKERPGALLLRASKNRRRLWVKCPQPMGKRTGLDEPTPDMQDLYWSQVLGVSTHTWNVHK